MQSLVLTIHEVKIAIPSSINLIVTCTHNDEKFETTRKKRVDGSTSVANFADQELIIPMSTANPSNKGDQQEPQHYPQQ